MVDNEMGEIHTNNNEIECYICTGDDPIPWKSDCNCTDRYVHSECQIELIDKTGSLKCPVYNLIKDAGVKIETVWVRRSQN